MPGKAAFLDFRPSLYFLSLTWYYSTSNDEQAPSYPQDQTAWIVLGWSMRIVPRICKLEMFLLLSLLVWLVDLAQLPDPSSLLPMLQHGFYLVTSIFQKKSAPSWPLHGVQLSFRKCWPAVLWRLSQGLQGNTCSSMFFLWAAEESLLWYQRLLRWSWLCCGFSLPVLLPMLCAILPFKFALGGTVSLADVLLFGLWWVWYGTSSVQHRAPPVFSGRPPLLLLP